jgi:glycosyltransferase involved in cell wall biosynthesis
MRIALVAHGLPPRERTGVETHVAALAAALARAGADVLVLAARSDRELPHLAERRERREGYVVDWLVVNEPPRDVLEEAQPPGVAEAVGEWLDRERPDAVHVHHVKGLGWAVLTQVRERGLPLVFTAHDYYAVCHRVTRLRPDLERCEVLGDAARCARCDLAVGLLHGRAELGDWHMGVLADQLEEEARDRLAQALDGEPQSGELERALELRRRANAQRERALAASDLVVAPTRHVLDALARGGVERGKLCLVPYAIETDTLATVSPPAQDQEAPLRFGFLGGVSKHKGLHVLAEAFRGVAGATLEVFGDSSDRPYVERVRALCDEVAATWHGAFSADDLPRVLGSIDVVCVPSLWDENAPFVIREAFAAGRPVLASRLGALPESVRDAEDGLLVEAGDPEAWRAVLARLAADRAEVRRLAAGVRTPPALTEHARELLALYGDLVARHLARRREGSLPEHLWDFEGRRDGIGRLSHDALLERVRVGLLRLRGELVPGSSSALGQGPDPQLERARELVRARRREARWARATAADDGRARRSLAAEAQWLRDVLAERERELAWRREESEAAATSRRRELEALGAELAQRRAEVQWLRETVSGLEREGRDQARAREAAERALATLVEHERWLRETARALAAELGASEALAGEEPIPPERLARAVEQARARAHDLHAELGWRREEMERALREGGPLLRALVGRSALGRRFDGWREEREGGVA